MIKPIVIAGAGSLAKALINQEEYFVVINRFRDNTKESLGDGKVYKKGYLIFEFKTLELPWKQNAKYVSCIPPGIVYNCVKRSGKDSGHFTYDHIHLTNTPDRSYVLWHRANFVSELLGCTAVGKHHVDIDKDGLPDVSTSKPTLDHLMKILPDNFKCIYTIDNSLNNIYGI